MSQCRPLLTAPVQSSHRTPDAEST